MNLPRLCQTEKIPQYEENICFGNDTVSGISHAGTGRAVIYRLC